MQNFKVVVAFVMLNMLIVAKGSASSLEELLAEKGIIARGETGANASSPSPSKIYWNKGTRFEFPEQAFAMQLNILMQTRYTFSDADESAGHKNSSSFDVNKARIIVSGSALNSEFEYNITTDMVGAKAEDGSKSVALLDGYLVWKPCKEGAIKFGQWKTGISRQFVASDQSLQFADRSLASNFFNLGRQAGAQLAYKGEAVSASAAIFNGTSDGEGINRSAVDTRHTGIASVRADVAGKQNVNEEGDVDGTSDLAVNFGASYAYSDAQADSESGEEASHQQIANVDANLKYEGFSTHAEFYWERFDPELADASEPLGGYVQFGYFLLPSELEVAARYSLLECDDGSAAGKCSGNDKVHEVTAGLNYFWWKHNLKAQLNFTHESQDQLEASAVESNKWLLQLSAYL